MSFPPPGEENVEPSAPPPPAPPVPGWWLASDGNWYPPQPDPSATPAYGPPPTYGPPPAYGPPQAYGPGPSAYGYSPYTPKAGTNGFAIASLVLGLLWFYWVGSILAIIFGFVALGQIKQRNQSGRGMAIAGIILAFLWIAILVLAVIAVAVSGTSKVGLDQVHRLVY